MKIIDLAIPAAAVACGVGLIYCLTPPTADKPDCLPPWKYHRFGQWTNTYTYGPNSFGYIHQTRHCENCGLVNVEAHK